MKTPVVPDFPRPFTLVDVVIFAVRAGRLQVLLVRRPRDKSDPFPGRWALPGGFVDVARDADLLACARRKLLEKTAVASPYLEQLGSWGSARRDPRGWSATHVYFALIAAPDEPPTEGGNATQAGWFPVDALPGRRALAFDHDAILRAAIERLRGKVEYTSLPAFLLPEPFTLPQLQKIYEIVLGRAVDKSSFRTRMLAMDFLDEAGIQNNQTRRPAMSYRLRDRRAPVVFPRTFEPPR